MNPTSGNLAIATWNVANAADFAQLRSLDKHQNQRVNSGLKEQINEARAVKGLTKPTINYETASAEEREAYENAKNQWSVVKQDQLDEHRTTIMQSIIQLNPQDIFCFQEVGTSTNMIAQALQGSTYNFYKREGQEDTAVAWNVKRFDLIKEHDLPEGARRGDRSKEFTIVDLYDRQTKTVIRVVSAHLSSVHPTQSRKGEEEHSVLNTCLAELERLNQDATLQKPDVVVWGMDANIEQKKDGSKPERFEKLEQEGYELDRNTAKTVVSLKYSKTDKSNGKPQTFIDEGEAKGRLEAKIDYIAFKGSAKFLEIMDEKVEQTPLLNTFENSSDHRPSYALLEIVKLPPTAVASKSLWNKFFG